MDYIVEEVDGVFVLPIAGFVCVGRDHRGVVARSEDSGIEANLPVNDEELAGELVGRRARVERATVSPESTLRIEFDGGTILEIPASDEFEAWEISVADGSIFVVAPAGGGEPAIFDATSETTTIRPGEPVPQDLAAMLGLYGLELAEAVELRRSVGRTESIQMRQLEEE